MSPGASLAQTARQQLGFGNHGLVVMSQQTKAPMSDPHSVGSQTYVLDRFGSDF